MWKIFTYQSKHFIFEILIKQHGILYGYCQELCAIGGTAHHKYTILIVLNHLCPSIEILEGIFMGLDCVFCIFEMYDVMEPFVEKLSAEQPCYL